MPRPSTGYWTSRPVTLLLAVPAGLAMWAAFPDLGWWPIGVIAVAVLHGSLGRDHAGWNFLVGLVAGLVFFLPLLYWAYDATALVPWLALSTLAALGLAVFGVAWTWARRLPWVRGRAWAHVLAFATVWTAVEQWRSQVPFGGFPWGRLAWSVAGAPTGRAAWLGGTPLVSFLVAAAGALLAVACRRVVHAVRDPQAWARHLTVAATAVCVGVMGLVGPAWLPLPAAGDEKAVADPPVKAAVDVPDRSVFVDAGTAVQQSGVLRVGVVQGNVNEPGLGSFANRAEVLNNHLKGTQEIADDIHARASRGDVNAGVDVVLWPENGSDLDPQQAQDVAGALDAATDAVGAPILVGAQEFPKTGGRYNVLLLWQDGKGVISRYAKQRPAPFGEYIPMRSFVRLFSNQVDRVTTDMIAGKNPPLIELPSPRLGRTVRLGTAICFEVAYDDILRDAVRRGAEVLVVPTNNASFGVTPQSTQQLQMTRLQAMANGRAAVQVSTVGVSGVIAPDGTLVARTGLFTADHLSAALPLRSTWTPAVAAGYWPGWVVSAAGGLLAICGVVTNLLRRRAKRSA